MKPPHQHSRINLDELKAQIVKKLGPDGSKQYFYYLQRFLSLKQSKAEFNKLCLRIFGRENIPLHNLFIRSILRNACSAKAPPPPANHHKDDIVKQVTHGNEITSDGHQQNGSHTGIPQASGSPGLSNGGDMLLPLSPRKARTGLRDRRIGDRRSALRPNGKTSFAPQFPNLTQSSDFNVVLENGDLNPPLQHHQGLIQQAESENVGPAPAPAPDEPVPVYSKEQTDLVVGNDEKDAMARSPLQAPLGIPLCPASIGGAHRAPTGSTLVGTFCDGALLDSHALRERMEHIAVAQGLEGVSVDCANILNHGLDSYMKGLIKSCIGIVGARSGRELTKNIAQNKGQNQMKLINGVKLGYQHQLGNSGAHSGLHEQKTDSPISLQDFRVAMELNPQQLGEDWPLLLEKICIHAFEE